MNIFEKLFSKKQLNIIDKKIKDDHKASLTSMSDAELIELSNWTNTKSYQILKDYLNEYLSDPVMRILQVNAEDSNERMIKTIVFNQGYLESIAFILQIPDSTRLILERRKKTEQDKKLKEKFDKQLLI